MDALTTGLQREDFMVTTKKQLNMLEELPLVILSMDSTNENNIISLKLIHM